MSALSFSNKLTNSCFMICACTLGFRHKLLLSDGSGPARLLSEADGLRGTLLGLGGYVEGYSRLMGSLSLHAFGPGSGIPSLGH